MTKQVALIAIVLFVGVAIIALLPAPRRVVFCNFTNTFENVSAYTVYVSEPERQRFQREVVQFFKENGVKVSSGQMSVSDATNSSIKYLDLQSIACDGYVFAWIGNDLHPNEFAVTFHANRIFGTSAARKISGSFQTEFGKKYRISYGVGWRPAH